MTRSVSGASVALALLTYYCRPAPTHPTLTVAAAANLSAVFNQLGPGFESETGIHPVFSFGSTAQLARQIENAAPFDVIAAADSAHIDDLERKGLLLPGSKAVYATGVLALWIPSGSRAAIGRIQDLTSAQVRIIAIAKPELAPYGEATVEALRNLGIWDSVSAKIVYAENISMAKQYGESGNADAVFTAYSLVLNAPGKTMVVDQTLHPPIRQSLGIVARSQHTAEARRFTAYVLRGAGRSVLKAYGYRP